MILDWTQIYSAVFILALSMSLAFTPLCQALARRTGFLDIPKCENHKLHANATPLLGGLAMFSAWMMTILVGIAATSFINEEQLGNSIISSLAGMHNVQREFIVLCLCAFASLCLGLYDDKKSLKAWKKLIGQIIIAMVTASFAGVRISVFIQSDIVSWFITVFWIIFIFNSINFFDNMDGLAVGTAAIAFSFFTLAAVMNQQYFIACLGACSAGAAIGFWFFNHSPASIFMGDGGSHFLGYLLAVISAKITYFNPEFSTTRFTVLIPIFILAVPIFDTLAVVVIRLCNKKPIYVGDHNHISHRFHHMGMTRKRAVLLVHLLALIAGLGALPLLWGDEKTCFLLIVQGLVILLLLTLIQYSGNPLHLKEQPEKK